MITALRHAPPVQSGVCAGRSDLPVLDIGERLQTLLGQLRELRLREIHSSPSVRCCGLANLLAEPLGLMVHVDDRLLELDFGQWEGRAWAEITRDDRARFEAWSANWQSNSPPGGESVAELEQRVRSFLADLPPEQILVVTHAGPIRALRVLRGGWCWAQAMTQPVPYRLPIPIRAGSTDPASP